jgi:hypothetical protein
MEKFLSPFLVLCAMILVFPLISQVQDTTSLENTSWQDDEEEEDYSLYDDIDFADESAKRFASAKVFDLSPQRFISIHWDAQLPYAMNFSDLGNFPVGENSPTYSESATANYTGGLRMMANIPVVSKNSIIWQMGANYWDTRYNVTNVQSQESSAGLLPILQNTGLRTMGLNTTVFKPINDELFLLFQGSADLSGNYTLENFQSLKYLRYSGAALIGKRPSDRKQWALGIARTYRVGELNYLPILLYNYTAPNRKWGTEILFPARAHYRRTFNPRSILLAGYELEGQSYRIRELSTDQKSLEIRRGELRLRAEYMRQITGFIWLSAQAGLRYDYSFNADFLPEDGKEFFRGFFGTQPFAMLNSLGTPLYFNIGIHLVSP